jgi:molybdenum cofactor cytidylyltransferase
LLLPEFAPEFALMSVATAGTVGILLAAGRGRRFDASGAQNKLLQALPGGDLVVLASARHMLAVLPRVIAVVRPGGDQVASALHFLGCEVVVAQDADSGMASSLVYAIGSTQDATGWIIALGDMPHVASATIAALQAKLADGADIVVPTFQQKRGNPVGFGRRHLPLLLALQGDQGARSILQQHPVTEVDVTDSGILQDIDTHADLASVQ